MRMHGGRFVAETLMPLMIEAILMRLRSRTALEAEGRDEELAYYQFHYVGRPSRSRTCAERLTASSLDRAKLYLEACEPRRTQVSHKINNVLGQALLAKRMGKTRIIAETGAGQHGVATATARRCSTWNARSSWARRMSVARSRLSTACAFSAPRYIP